MSIVALKMFVSLKAAQAHMLWKKACALSKQAFIILTWHGNIDVVVPRDEAMVADGTKQGTAGEVICKPQFIACLLYTSRCV